MAFAVHNKETAILAIKAIEAIRKYNKANKVQTTFMKPILRAADGDGFLRGSFKQGGTVSGRLSSSDPNLQNMPSKGPLGKLVKYCVQAPEGWIFGGADFWSLEDRISALQTKDPAKIAVYADGYDGHSLRAFSYFSELGRLPEDFVEKVNCYQLGQPKHVELINSIEKDFSDVRTDSKAPTFLLTYRGTSFGLRKNCGFPDDVAEHIESSYHSLYHVSDAWVDSKLEQATHDGYVTLAFGLKLRTPKLAQVVWKAKQHLPKAAEEESRTAGNALGQSYGLLNSRAGVEFLERVNKSEYRTDILMCAQIHDAIYLMWRDDLEITEWVNKNLTECMAWNELPEIQHPDVPLGGDLSLFYPSWAHEIVIKDPNASGESIQEVALKQLKEWEAEGLL